MLWRAFILRPKPRICSDRIGMVDSSCHCRYPARLGRSRYAHTCCKLAVAVLADRQFRPVFTHDDTLETPGRLTSYKVHLFPRRTCHFFRSRKNRDSPCRLRAISRYGVSQEKNGCGAPFAPRRSTISSIMARSSSDTFSPNSSRSTLRYSSMPSSVRLSDRPSECRTITRALNNVMRDLSGPGRAAIMLLRYGASG